MSAPPYELGPETFITGGLYGTYNYMSEFQGPWMYNDNYYLAVMVSSGGVRSVRIYRSVDESSGVDEGVSWTPQDISSTMVPVFGSGGHDYFSCALTPSGRYVYVVHAYNLTVSDDSFTYALALSRFSLSANKWDRQTKYTNIITTLVLGNESGYTSNDSRKLLGTIWPAPTLNNRFLITALDDNTVYAIMTYGPVDKDGHPECGAAWTNFATDVTPTIFRPPEGGLIGGVLKQGAVRIDGIASFPYTTLDVYAITSAPIFNYDGPTPTTPVPDAFNRKWLIIAGPNVGVGGSLSEDVFHYNAGIGPTMIGGDNINPYTPAFGMGSPYGGVTFGFTDWSHSSADTLAIPIKNSARHPCVDIIVNRAPSVREVISSSIPASTFPSNNVPPPTTGGLSADFSVSQTDYTMIFTFDAVDSNLNVWFFEVNDSYAVSPLRNVYRSLRNGAGDWTTPLQWFNIPGTYINRFGILHQLTSVWTGHRDQWNIFYADRRISDCYFRATLIPTEPPPPPTGLGNVVY